MKYICECGKEFETPNSFNGHKAHCKIHLGLTKYEENKKQMALKSKKGAKIKHEKAELKKLEELTKWVSEQHICEKCGKIMTSKFGSGRFCSRACANSREQTPELNLKRSKTSNRTKQHTISIRHIQALNTYLDKPKVCPICNEIISYKNRYKNTCGKETCEHLYRSYKAKKMHEEGRNKGWIKRNIISFPESFWIKVLDTNSISYKKQFKVVWPEKTKYYFLDFLINDKIDLEIDGAQHLTEEHKIKDEERDNYVKSQGYIVYRIPWKGLKEKDIINSQIKDLLDFIKQNN